MFTFSIHDVRWCDIFKHNHLDVELPPHTGDTAYLAALAEHLPRIVSSFAPDLAMYVAGSDPYVGDPLGVFDLTELGIFARDRMVTAETFGKRIPLAVVTAGGYGETSWRMYFNYFRWLLDDSVVPGGMSDDEVLGNYDAPALLALLQEYGVGRALRARGLSVPTCASTIAPVR